MLHQKLIQHNELMELKDPGGYLDRAAPSDICYAKFVDFLSEESERDHAIAIVAVDLEYAHRSLFIDFQTMKQTFNQSQENRVRGVINALDQLGILSFLTAGASKKVQKKIEELRD